MNQRIGNTGGATPIPPERPEDVAKARQVPSEGPRLPEAQSLGRRIVQFVTFWFKAIFMGRLEAQRYDASLLFPEEKRATIQKALEQQNFSQEEIQKFKQLCSPWIVDSFDARDISNLRELFKPKEARLQAITRGYPENKRTDMMFALLLTGGDPLVQALQGKRVQVTDFTLELKEQALKVGEILIELPENVTPQELADYMAGKNLLTEEPDKMVSAERFMASINDDIEDAIREGS